jgi:putative phosphoribosyl transferase
VNGPQRQTLSVELPPYGAEGLLGLPAGPASGLVLFAHGSGSSRFSPRNGFVAQALQESGLATLLFDLLTEAESEERHNVFDIPLLAVRLSLAAAWARESPLVRSLPLGYFGASTGAAAALAAAATDPAIGAVVSRGGRPDLAGDALARVEAPTLLIVGGEDFVVLELNREALGRMHCDRALRVVPRATHLFEEPGTLREATDLARAWFRTHLAAS